MWKNGITAVKVKVTVKVQNVSEYLSGWYLLNGRTFWYQTWYGDAASWARGSCGFIFLSLLPSRSRSQWRPILSRYDSFCYIFWTVDSLATKLGLMIHHHRPECVMKKEDYCIQGQGHSEVGMSVFVQIISSKPPNVLFSTLGLWCTTMSQSVMQKIVLLFSRSGSQQGLIWSKHDNFYCIF